MRCCSAGIYKSDAGTGDPKPYIALHNKRFHTLMSMTEQWTSHASHVLVMICDSKCYSRKTRSTDVFSLSTSLAFLDVMVRYITRYVFHIRDQEPHACQLDLTCCNLSNYSVSYVHIRCAEEILIFP